jgi:tRNA 2-(methylsulfanyl)-N6-isopentenyladenosine37 hydroxylase
MLQLQTRTPERWLEIVFADFDAFLVDHTLCERKASANALSLVAKYPDRDLILEPLIAFAREELEHFHIMFKVLARRGLRLPGDAPDAYVNGLRKALPVDPEGLLLDRLLVPAVVEARSCERLQMVMEALQDPELKQTYLELVRAEARHHAFFFRMAEHYYPAERVRERGRALFQAEAELIERLPLRAAVH